MTTTAVSKAFGEQDVYVVPVSFGQQRLWFLHQLEPHSTAYNEFFTVRISTQLNVEALEHSLNAIVQRHEVLRTTFVMRDGQPMQKLLPSLSLPLDVIDLQHLPEAQRAIEALRLANEEVQCPFDLAHGPLLRTTLLRLGAQEYVFLLVIHHIIFDGWSVG